MLIGLNLGSMSEKKSFSGHSPYALGPPRQALCSMRSASLKYGKIFD
jgi:hypothetical protein